MGDAPPPGPASDKPKPWKKISLWVLAALTTALLAAFVTDAYRWIVDLVTPDGDPVRVDAVSVNIDEPGAAFAKARTLTNEELRALNASDDFGAWAHEHGGVGIAEAQTIAFTLRGNRKHTVRITGMKLVKKTCAAPLSGMFLNSPTAGDAGIRELSFDLDVPKDTVESSYFAKRRVTLKKDEQEDFILTTPTQKQFCSFTIEAAILDKDKNTTVTIDDHGRPFTVTAVLPREQYQTLYVGGVASCPPGRWSRQNPKTFLQDGCADPS
ncbi:hypothetical protein ACFVGY_14860 [Streptomyces sp. NPDC127106]|uniref:hypothetical protein n=1 Tax=Streptomyces sp. NPDC127106 TaxID=3345360 RepID=UPI003634041D